MHTEETKQILLKLLKALGDEADGDCIDLCDEFSKEQIEEILSDDYGWTRPSYEPLKLEDIDACANDYMYADGGRYDRLVDNGIDEREALRFMEERFGADSITDDAKERYLYWLNREFSW